MASGPGESLRTTGVYCYDLIGSPHQHTGTPGGGSAACARTGQPPVCVSILGAGAKIPAGDAVDNARDATYFLQ